MDIVRKNYPELPPTGAPHFQSVRAGNLLFLAGATARGTEAEFGDIAEQTDVILKRIQHILEAEDHQLCDRDFPRSRGRHPCRPGKILR